MSIWEQVAVILSKGSGNHGERQYRLFGEIDEQTEKVISEIHYKLRKGEVSASKESEIEKIKVTIKKGQAKEAPDSVVDLFVKIKDQENYFDITSAKPNIKEFVALRLSINNLNPMLSESGVSSENPDYFNSKWYLTKKEGRRFVKIANGFLSSRNFRKYIESKLDEDRANGEWENKLYLWSFRP